MRDKITEARDKITEALMTANTQMGVVEGEQPGLLENGRQRGIRLVRAALPIVEAQVAVVEAARAHREEGSSETFDAMCKTLALLDELEEDRLPENRP